MCFSFGLPILQRLDIILVTNIEFLLFVPAACGCEGSWKMDMFRKKPDPKEALRASKREMSVATRGEFLKKALFLILCAMQNSAGVPLLRLLVDGSFL
jgi:hypothetical protein